MSVPYSATLQTLPGLPSAIIRDKQIKLLLSNLWAEEEVHGLGAVCGNVN